MFVAAYVKRVIVHPSFHNIDYKTCEKLMRTMEQGEVVMRPSSKVSTSPRLQMSAVIALVVRSVDSVFYNYTLLKVIYRC